MPVLVDAAGITVSTADRVLFGNLNLTVTDGDRVGVVGINGAGKSTLLRVLAGAQAPDGGEVRRGRGTRISVLDQQAPLPDGTVGQALGEGWEKEALLDRLGMRSVLDRQVSELSGGQAKRVALALALARPAELLVLDEPTNHLDLAAIAWLEAWLLRYPGGVLLVSHDRHLLDRATTRMVELDRGRSYLHEDGYSGYLAARAQREERAVDAEAVRSNLARRELAWLRRGAKARSRKPQARVDAAVRLLASGPEAPARPTTLELGFTMPRLGSKVIEAHDVSVAYGPSSAPVLADVRLGLDPKERLGVLGLNGSGKSTLLDLLSGRLAPSSGRVEHGTTVQVGHYTQQGPELDPAAQVRTVVAGPNRTPGQLADRQLMDRFWFSGELQWATVATLSGGERRRLQLLIVLASQPNVLLLDEPTNDLDLDTLRVLEEFLEEWPGALVTVSHDRTFLERVTTRVVACRDGRVDEVPGGLDAWVADMATGEARRPAPREVPKTGPGPAAGRGKDRRAGPSKRSASTVGFELRALDKELERLNKHKQSLALAFEAATDHQELARTGSELAAAQDQLEQAEERWLALADEAGPGR